MLGRCATKHIADKTGLPEKRLIADAGLQVQWTIGAGVDASAGVGADAGAEIDLHIPQEHNGSPRMGLFITSLKVLNVIIIGALSKHAIASSRELQLANGKFAQRKQVWNKLNI
jgi:hypothetical protein